RGVDDDHPLAEVISKDASDLPEHRRLAHARSAKEQRAASRLDDIANDRDRPVNGAADAAGQANDAAFSVTNARDAMKRALDSGAIVRAELADSTEDILDVGGAHLLWREDDLASGEPGLRRATEVENDLKQTFF